MLSQRLDGMVGRASLNQPNEREIQSTSFTSVLSALHSHSKSLANGCAPGGKALHIPLLQWIQTPQLHLDALLNSY